MVHLVSYLFDSSDRHAESVPTGQKNRYLQSTNAKKITISMKFMHADSMNVWRAVTNV